MANDSPDLGAIATSKELTINGVVKDEAGLPIIGATVLVENSPNGAITDVEGGFSIAATAGSAISVQFMGFETHTFNLVEAQTLYNITLREAALQLDDVVVTSYGSRQLRSEITTSVAKVDTDVFEKGFYANPAQALTGAVAGMSVVNSTGDPTKAPQITLRGGTNFDGTGTPLYIIDGQVRDHMHHLSPDDIESMEVLKDAGSTAIYGARANNGVILVTTKKGKSGGATIGFSNRLTIKNFKSNYDFLDAGEYLHWFRKAYQNSAQVYQDASGNWQGFADISDLDGAQPYGTGNKYFGSDGLPLDGNLNSSAVWSTMKYSPELAFLLDQGWQLMKDPVYGYDIIYQDFSLQDVNINSPSISQNYQFNVTGGNDRGNYYASLGYTKDNGIIPNNYYNRLNFTFNSDYKVKDWMKSYSSLKFSTSDWSSLPLGVSSDSNYFQRILSVPPTMRKYNPNGEYILGPNVEDSNQLVNMDKLNSDINETLFDMSQSFEFNLNSDLSLRVNSNWLYDIDTRESFYQDYISRPGVVNTSRYTSASFERYLTQMYNAHLNYDKRFGEHSISAMAAAEFFDKTQLGFSASGSGAPTDDFADLGLTSSAAGIRSIDSWHTTERILSFIGRVAYNYQSKYFVEFVARQDGYSKLLGDNRFGFFPGVSTGWVFGRENFMESLSDVVSFAKLRASYGVNGNASGITPYGLQGSYSSVKYNGDVGYMLTTMPNPYLLWERTNSFDVGLDFGLLNNRINMDITYYNRMTRDKYADVPLSTSSGLSSIRTNSGELQNKGVEMSVNFKAIRSNDWSMDIGINAAYNKNVVVSLPDNGLLNNRQGGQQIYNSNGDLIWVGGYQEGQSPGTMVAFKAEGIYKDWSEIPGYLVNSGEGKTLYGPKAWAALSDSEKAKGLPITPGDVKWKDVNGDGVIDQYDQVVVGNAVPKWTGGANLGAGWRNFSLSMRMDFALGFHAYDYSTAWLMGAAQGSYNTIVQSMDTWTPENPDAKYPRYDRADQLGKNNYSRVSSQFVYNSSYLAFREIGLEYALPRKLTEKANISNASVMFAAQNLGFVTSKEAKLLYSPEATGGITGTKYGGYAPPRTYVMGLNLTF
ncbi:MAG: SusC/RagA family TonB-linked outer membrane protein [Rikenellaceae bacterium]